MISPELVRHYDRRVPRYTSYPTAPHFTPALTRDRSHSSELSFRGCRDFRQLTAMALVPAIRAHAWTFAGASRVSARAYNDVVT